MRPKPQSRLARSRAALSRLSSPFVPCALGQVAAQQLVTQLALLAQSAELHNLLIAENVFMKPRSMSPDERKMWEAYQSQARKARRRGVGFTISFEEWRAWWLVDDRWSNRGLKRGQFVMARKGDAGPYDLSNIYLATSEQNQADIPKSVRVASAYKGADTQRGKAGSYAHLRTEVHPRRLSIRSPEGVFPSIAAAGRHYGLTARAIGYRLSAWDGWERV